MDGRALIPVSDASAADDPYVRGMTPSTTTGRRSLGQLALALGIAGLLPVPGILASLAAIVCGRTALRDSGDDSGSARLGLGLGILGALASFLVLFVYCVVLGYPFPIHRYRAR